MPEKPPRKLKGRPVADENGNKTWTWQSEETVDTAKVRALGEELSLDSSPPNKQPASRNPYDRGLPDPPLQDAPKRRTLDDMRRLSEHIKKSKHWKPDR